MLPFNRADFLRVDEKDDREDEGQPLNNTMNGLKEKPILNGIIEMGQDDNWCLELKKKYNRDSVAECSWSFGNNYLQDSSFVIVPFLTIWNIVPLLYYELFNRIVRFYCRALMRSMDMERRKRHFSLKFYYEQFLRITTVQEAIGDLFNPFVLFSFAWSMMILCLTIYFLANIGQGTSLWNPITVEQVYSEKARKRLTTNVHFIMGWASVQVIVAIMHIAIICSTGLKTNESTRQIVNSVLRIVPDANADLDRFQVDS
ncbi:hypothetical protein WR25_07019 [Diploscapter pachys]|uniref:Uncharacterized protein n=1 Tax=Diploscapter pachys TaxID=2018661 RepID=A0A2A2JS03_9BILA|nr:hypothetical protein WR25_07019 [Diploscapter pachys]